MPAKIENRTRELNTINEENINLNSESNNNSFSNKNNNNNNNKNNKNKFKLPDLATKQQQDKQNKKFEKITKMNDIKKAPVLTANPKNKQFIPLKSATNAKDKNNDDMIRGSMQRSKSNSDAKFNNNSQTLKKGTSPNTPNSKNKKLDPIKAHHVDMHQLDAALLPNSRLNKSKQDTYSLTHSIAKESWQQNYKECMRHQRLVKDDNLEKKCSSCGILYVLCEACRHDQQIPFNDDDTCIDCAPSAYKVRGLIQKKDALIRELHYKAHRMEDDVVKSQKEIDQLRQRVHESDQLRQEMQDDYRKAVAECMSKENENLDLVQKLASAIKEIHQLQVSTKTHEELIKDFNKLLVSGDYADCQVQIGSTGERIALHRAILATRSDYFRSMLGDTPQLPPPPPKGGKGGNNPGPNVINLDNISRDNVNQILEYIYCGKCRNITDDTSAKELYELANRLGFNSLKDIVVDYYVNKLNRDNCLQIASKTLYIQNSSEKYREFIKNYILTECSDLIEFNASSEQWRRLKQENPAFVVELLENKIQKDEKRYKKYSSLKNNDEYNQSSTQGDASVADTTETSKSTIGNTVNYNNNTNNLKALTPKRTVK